MPIVYKPFWLIKILLLNYLDWSNSLSDEHLLRSQNTYQSSTGGNYIEKPTAIKISSKFGESLNLQGNDFHNSFRIFMLNT